MPLMRCAYWNGTNAMKTKVKIQMGAYDRKWGDLTKLVTNDKKVLLEEILASLTVDSFKVVNVHKMVLGEPFLIEWEYNKVN